jgi:two-component system, sensor histidine kinase and response regulator
VNEAVTKPGEPRVLLVDDRRDNLLALRAVLEPLDLDLVSAGSGAEALAALLQDEYAVVVLDVQMPDMDGFETARLIKGRERTRLLPIIFLTAISGEPQHHLAGYRAGAVDYIKKPFDPDILRAKVLVFAELWRRGRLIEEQRTALAEQIAAIDRLNNELERSNAMLNSFASKAAEDLLEPLDVIAGFLELLVLRHADVLGGEGGLLVQRATALANRQRERVVAMLEYADAGSVSVEVESVDLRDAIEEACARAGLNLGGTTVQVTGESSTVPGDQRQLVRLLELLIERAVRRANASTVSVAVENQGGAVLVRVIDDGKCPTGEETSAMFSDLPGGSMDDPERVGLLVSRRVVERHGGSIWAEPGDRTGTVISFTLPDIARSDAPHRSR